MNAMRKRVQEYVKYTLQELDEYTQAKDSCVRKVNTNLHLSMEPFCLTAFKNVLMAHLVQSKVGFYDVNLDGIVLDVKKIKVLSTTGAIRADDPKIHVNINADVYVFKPEEGAELTGVVKQISPYQVGVILYRVFKANLRLAHKLDKTEIEMEQEVMFRIRKCNLQNVFPYIDGELLTTVAEKNLDLQGKSFLKSEDNVDSGIEERDGVQELDGLLSALKTEAPSEYEEAMEESNLKQSRRSKKRKTGVEEPLTVESSHVSTNKKLKKRKKSSADLTITEDSETLTDYESKKIKHELISNDDSLLFTPKKITKTKESSKKQRKGRDVLVEDVKIKEELNDSD